MGLAANALCTLEGAKLIAGVASTSAVAATGTLTSSGANVSADEKITIDTKVYTFKTALTPTEGQVLIGGTAPETMANLVAAILHAGTPDVDYKCAAVHPTVSATSTSGTVIALTAKTAGTAGNAIDLISTASAITVSGAHLSGGTFGVATDDPLFEAIINGVSSMIEAYCQRSFKVAALTETYAPTNRTRLALRSWPVQSVTSVTAAGSLLVDPDDYTASDADKAAGMLYKPDGWTGTMLLSHMTSDPVAGEREIAVVYSAGYILPSGAGYSEGGSTSLPVSISGAAALMAARQYFATKRQSFGLSSLSEGGISYSFADPARGAGNNASGIDADIAGILNKYRRVVIA